MKSLSNKRSERIESKAAGVPISSGECPDLFGYEDSDPDLCRDNEAIGARSRLFEGLLTWIPVL